MPSRFKLQLWGLKDVPPSLEALRTPTPFAQRGQAQTRFDAMSRQWRYRFGTRQRHARGVDLTG